MKIQTIVLGQIHVFGLVVGLLWLLPNLLFGKVGAKDNCVFPSKKLGWGLEIGRFGSLIFLAYPADFFDFGSVFVRGVYQSGAGVLLTLYLLCWALFLSNPDKRAAAVALSVLSSAVFVFSGVIGRHLPLLFLGVLYGGCHLYATWYATK